KFVVAVNYDGDAAEWERTTGSAYGVGNRSARFDNYDVNLAGTSDALILPPMDFTQVNNAVLSFDLAYARYNPNIQILDDQLHILVSTDCGRNYDQQIYLANSQAMETASPRVTAFTPSSDEWKTEEVDLSAFNGMESITIAFVNRSAGGNRLYLDNINVDQNCQLSISAEAQDPLCAGANDGSISINLQNSTGEASFAWSENVTTTGATATDLPQGNYELTVTDQNCSSSIAIALSDPLPISISLALIDESASGANDGRATPIVSGGTGSYTYAWSTGDSDAALTGLAPGNYSLSITDANGCEQVEPFNIAAFQCATLAATTAQDDIDCNGTATGQINVSFANPERVQSLLWNTGATTSSLSNLAAGSYTIIGISDQ
ncbi:MAG: hypothetical protein AAFO94_20930, partial [Bacteroidota bacterium]